jgi:hypothetical protein
MADESILLTDEARQRIVQSKLKRASGADTHGPFPEPEWPSALDIVPSLALLVNSSRH